MSEGYYYDLATGRVVEGKVRSAATRMGPYATREEAEQALAGAQDRNEEWQEADRVWQGEEDA